MSAYYIAAKLFTYLVLPPGIFILLLFIASFYAKRFKILLFLGTTLFYALSTSYVSNALYTPLEKPFNKPLAQANVDAIIVLGGGAIEGSSNMPLSSSAYKRALWGLMLAKQKNLPLLFSGAGLGEYTEADAFLQSMQELEKYLHVKTSMPNSFSFDTFSLYIENRSLNTYENGKFSKEFFEKIEIKKPKVYLVTSAYHMKRSMKIFKHFGFEVVPAATDFTLSTKKEILFPYLPNMQALVKSYRAIREHTGSLSLILKGIY